MAINDTNRSAALSLIRDRGAAVGKSAAASHTDRTGAATELLSEAALEIERTLQIDPARGVDRIGIEALEGLLAEIDADDALTLRLSLHDETPVRLGLALATVEADRQRALAAALDLAAALINTERRA